MPADVNLTRSIGDVFRKDILSRADEHFVRCGSLTLCLKFTSPELAGIFLPSFMSTSERNAGLTIAFAGASDIDLSDVVPVPRDRPRIFADGAEYAAWQPGAKDVLSLLDFRSKRAVIWLPQDAPPAWYASRPALPLVHAITKDTPWSAVHGGCVGLDGRFLLLAGKGKSGKTTASLACARAGWDYAGDDFVFANTETGEIEPLFATARLRTTAASEFSNLLTSSAELSYDEGDERHELRLSDAFGRHRLKGGRIAAILLPRRLGSEMPAFSPARRSDVFAALLPSTSVGLLGWPDKTTRKVASLSDKAPAFFVDTGNTPNYIPDAFRNFLDRV